MEMRWQLMMAQLSQPVQTKEGARDYQRTVSDLWRATETSSERDLASEQSKKKLEEVTGFSFVRTGK